MEISPGSGATSIAVDGFNLNNSPRLWAMNSLHQLFVNASPRAHGAFTQVAGSGLSVASDAYSIGLIGDKFLNHGYQIFKRDVTTPTTDYGWQLQGGDATLMGSNGQGDFFVVNDLGELFWARDRF